MTIDLQDCLNPYVGPRAFRRGEKLYGRDQEIMELLDLLIPERIVLLYSPSGAGKTSLIQAALIPRLEQERFHILPVMRVGLEPSPVGRLAKLPNRYVLSLFLSLEESLPTRQQVSLDELADMELETYLDRFANTSDAAEYEVLIFDQFEEILTADPTDWVAKKSFFVQLGAALRNRARWALFAMREEYLGGLDPYLCLLPTRFSTTYRLDFLCREAALLAMQQPAVQAGVGFADAAAKKLVDDLCRVRVQKPDGRVVERLGSYVEPMQLQVVCHWLWEKLSVGTTRIEEADIKVLGDVDRALAGYYDEQVGAIARETSVSEWSIRGWFDHQLIIDDCFRSQVLKGRGHSQGLPNKVIEHLMSAHLVRAEVRRGATWFELAHDRLIKPVLTANATWRRSRLDQLQEQVDFWQSHGCPSGVILGDQMLVEAAQWAEAHRNEVMILGHDSLAACLQAQTATEWRQRESRPIPMWLVTRIIKPIGLIVIVAFIAACITFLIFLILRVRAII